MRFLVSSEFSRINPPKNWPFFRPMSYLSSVGYSFERVEAGLKLSGFVPVDNEGIREFEVPIWNFKLEIIICDVKLRSNRVDAVEISLAGGMNVGKNG